MCMLGPLRATLGPLASKGAKGTSGEGITLCMSERATNPFHPSIHKYSYSCCCCSAYHHLSGRHT